ncbi:hypothetical protein myaer87_05910 [Microcystis aeruginosa NIES-87]|nr:hypothetical protein myaer87_05910 [Microcystis aeruginosa NIES-87]
MKDDLIYLGDILDRIERIESYTQEGKDRFYQSLLIQDAVIRCFEVRFFRTYTVENSPSSLSVQQCSKVDKYQSNKNSKPYCTNFTSMSC